MFMTFSLLVKVALTIDNFKCCYSGSKKDGTLDALPDYLCYYKQTVTLKIKH